jgi:uncharacterized membrane protein YbhN (UPF0104 family)
MTGDNPAMATQPLRARSARRGWALGIAVALVGAAMLVVLFEWSGIRLADLVARLSRSPLWLLPALMLLSASQVLLSAVKWREVLAAYAPDRERPDFRFCVFHSTLANLLSQVVSTYLSSTLVRGVATRRHRAFPVGRGVVSSAYEQLFDVVLMVVFALATVAAWLLHGGVGVWIGLTALGLGASCIAMLVARRLLAAVDKRRFPGFLERWRERAKSQLPPDIFDQTIAGKLLALSVARYAVIAVRAGLIGVAMGFAILPIDITQSFTLVFATQFASLTPGNLGLQEWSWSALLVLRHTPVSVAAEFAVTYRILTFVSTNLAMILLGLATWNNSERQR